MTRSSSLRLLRVFLLIPAVLLTSGDQAKSVPTQSYPTQTLYALYWSVESGFTSTLELKNNIMARGLTVHTSLYFANGEEQYLSALQLGPRETVVVDLNRVLGPQSNPGRREGSLKVWFEAKSPSAVMGSTTVTNSDKGIAWNFFLYPANPGLPNAPVGGVFWFRDDQTDGFVPVHNGSSEFMTVVPRFQIEGQVYALPPTSVAPGRFYRLELRKELRRLGLNNVNAGGLSFVYEGVPDALRAHGVLYNNKGFSAEIDFNRMDDWDEPQELALRTPRIAIGAAAPELGLPPRTTFKPVLALHNFNSYTMNLTLNVGYRVGGNPTEFGIPVTLASGQTRVLELHPYLQDVVAAGAPWASLEISYTSRHDGLAASLVSMSEDGNHSIRSVMNWVQGTIREGWYWRVDGDYNTLIGIFNSDGEEARATFSLDYYAEGQKQSYELPELTIPARDSMMINVGDVIAAGTPDTQGNVIPPGVTFGGYRLQRERPSDEGNLTTEVLIVDSRRRTFTTIYNTSCNCWRFPLFEPPSFTGFPNQGLQLKIKMENICTEDSDDLTVLGQYSVDDQSVAIVNAAGTVTLAAPGTATATSKITIVQELTLYQQDCHRRMSSGQCSLTVKPLISSITPPRGLIGNTTTVTINGTGLGQSPTVQAGTGITVNVTSATSTQIQANFVVASNAPAGNHSVTVTVNNQTSNAANFFVQIPTSLSIVPGTDSTTPPSTCTFTDSNGNPQTGCGVSRSFTYQVRDQMGQPIEVAGLQVWDEIYVTSPNNLGFTGFITTCSPANTGPCGFATDSLGQFQEASLSVCSSVCRSNNVCVTGGPTNANQIVHVGSFTITQAISYNCDGVTVNGQ